MLTTYSLSTYDIEKNVTAILSKRLECFLKVIETTFMIFQRSRNIWADTMCSQKDRKPNDVLHFCSCRPGLIVYTVNNDRYCLFWRLIGISCKRYAYDVMFMMRWILTMSIDHSADPTNYKIFHVIHYVRVISMW